MSVRRVQLTGKSTLIVSLPKKWTKKNGLKKGDSLMIKETKDGSLRIAPSQTELRSEQTLESEIKITEGILPETLSRKIISHYLTGYDIIKIFSDEQSLIGISHRNTIRETVHDLIGLEITEQTTREIMIQSLLDYTKFPISNVIQKMRNIAISMQKDSINALITGDLPLARDVIIRDLEVDRLYLLAVKQLKDMIRREEIAKMMDVNVRACLGYRVAVKCIERIADHSERIARNTIMLGELDLPKPIERDLVEMNRLACEVHTKAISALLTANEIEAETTIILMKSIEEIEKEIVSKLVKEHFDSHETICSIKSITDSLRRTADYGTDVAEIALNLAAGEPI